MSSADHGKDNTVLDLKQSVVFIPEGAKNMPQTKFSILKIVNLTVIVCHLGGPFSVVFPRKKTVNYNHVIYNITFFIGLTIRRDWSGYQFCKD